MGGKRGGAARQCLPASWNSLVPSLPVGQTGWWWEGLGCGSPSLSHQSLGRLPPGASSDGFPSWASQPQEAQGSLPQFALAR